MRYIIVHIVCAKNSQFDLKMMRHIIWAGHTGRGVRFVLLDPQHLHHTESPQVCYCYAFSPKHFSKVTNHSQLVNISHEISVKQKYVKSTLSSIVTFTHLINEKQDHQRWISTVDKLQVVWQMDRLMANG